MLDEYCGMYLALELYFSEILGKKKTYFSFTATFSAYIQMIQISLTTWMGKCVFNQNYFYRYKVYFTFSH